ncbi:MAG: hypothetical protein HY905_05745 [Deltaproteobacteria bacterium]|nr:hypothetical protein [Deltaproteobacteria bacterium]
MMRINPRILVLLLSLAVVLAAGCKGSGDAGTDTAADVRLDVAPETTADSPAEAEAEAAPEATAEADAAECDAGLLTGVWLSANYSVRFAADLSYEAAGAPNLTRIDVTGQAAVDGCQITFGHEGGTYACPDEQPGTYTFTVDATQLSFTLVSDACDGRRIPISGAVLTRE